MCGFALLGNESLTTDIRVMNLSYEIFPYEIRKRAQCLQFEKCLASCWQAIHSDKTLLPSK